MANKTYVALLTGGNDIKWVTGLDNETRTAYWEAEKPARPFTKRLAEDLAAMLRCNGHPAVTITAPNWRSFENGADWFGTVRWCDDDIRDKFEYADEDCTDDDIEFVRKKLKHHSFTDTQIEAGNDFILFTVRDYLDMREAAYKKVVAELEKHGFEWLDYGIEMGLTHRVINHPEYHSSLAPDPTEKIVAEWAFAHEALKDSEETAYVIPLF